MNWVGLNICGSAWNSTFCCTEARSEEGCRPGLCVVSGFVPIILFGNMKTTRLQAIPRLAVAIIGHLFLFAWWQDLFRWGGRTSEAWESFWIGSVSALILVFTVAAFLRGTPPEKIAAVGLSLLPAFCLIGALVVYANEFL